jgi:hypothetical protein
MGTRRSRFLVTPKGTSFIVTENDLRILVLLQRYRYLPSTYLAALVSTSYGYLKNRLTILRHEAGVIDCPRSSWHAANARYRPAVYCLTDKGEQVLKERGLYKPHPKANETFAHEFGVCLTMASFDLGAREHGLRLIDSDEILAHPSCPYATRHAERPFHLPLSAAFIKHDGVPFGLQGTKTLFFPGIEFDRKTEPLEPRDMERSSIRKHVESIIALGRCGYRHHYGIPNNVIPFVTISESRMRSIMRLVEKVASEGERKLFLFKYVSDFSAFEKFPPPAAHMLATPWLRAGHAPFDIVAELGGTHARDEIGASEGTHQQARGD